MEVEEEMERERTSRAFYLHKSSYSSLSLSLLSLEQGGGEATKVAEVKERESKARFSV